MQHHEMVLPSPHKLALPSCTGPTPLLLQEKPLSSLCVVAHVSGTEAYPLGLICVKHREIPGCTALPEHLSSRQITCRKERIQELEGIACKWQEQ